MRQSKAEMAFALQFCIAQCTLALHLRLQIMPYKVLSVRSEEQQVHNCPPSSLYVRSEACGVY